MAMPETVEQDHFGNPSFRVHGRIFVTVPDASHVNVMVDAFDVDSVVRENPESCSELWWGKKLSGVRVSMPDAEPAMVKALIEAAWRRKAPKRLLS
jgi:hypothetical protein